MIYCFYMGKLKTVVNHGSVADFIESVEDEGKRQDSDTLLKLFERVTGYPAKLWGTSIIGFGSYHYKSDRSKQEGDWPLAGFSPRKQALTIYIMSGIAEHSELVEKLGKHKTSVSCLYVKRLRDIDLGLLEKLIKQSVEQMKKTYQVNQTN